MLQRRLKLFGHVARGDQAEDHNRALRASLNPPGNWRQSRVPGKELSVTILNFSTFVYTHLNIIKPRSSFMAEDRGNRYAHIVGMPPDDDDDDVIHCVRPLIKVKGVKGQGH